MMSSVDYLLDWKDQKIIQQLDSNARQSAAEIAAKTAISKETVNYRINRMLERGLIKQFISFIDIQQLKYTFYDVFFKLKQYSAEEEKQVIEQIKGIHEVGWFVSTRGEWKFVVCFMAEDPAKFNNALAKVLKILGDKMLRYDLFIVLDAYQLPYKEILNAPKETYSKQTHLGKKKEIEMKETDLKLLEVLAKDARIPKNVLAEKTGLTLEMVRHSMKKLERLGVIQAYKPLLDVGKTGYSWHIMLLQFNYSTEKEKEEFLNFLKNESKVFYIVKGVGNWSLMVEFHTKTLDDFGAITDKINSKFEKLIANEAVLQVLTEHKCVFYPSA